MAAPTGSDPPGDDQALPSPTRAGVSFETLVALVGGRTPQAATGPVVLGVTLDSRSVRPGDLYAALPGARTHGARFIDQAVTAGAVAVLTDPAGRDLATAAGVTDLPMIEVDDPRARLGDVSACVYGDPATGLEMFGVTGTNGKTTTCYLLHAALTAAGHQCGLIGTVETLVGDRRLPSERTTPESPDLHALLALMVDAGATACAMEVSSHALALHRVDAVGFDIVGFTNLSQDHLDFHGSFQAYFEAKADLFTPARARRGVICVDDDWARRLAASATIPVVTFSTLPPVEDADEAARQPDWRVEQVRPDHPGLAFDLVHTDTGQRWTLISPIPGDFNVANTALAALMLHLAGIDPDTIAAGLAAAPSVPGRMQVVRATGEPTGAPGALPVGIVDFSHSPDSVRAALKALRSGGADPLVIVLGAGGDRDPGKRQAMGRQAALSADAVVVTDDNPRSEDPAAIRAAVLAGAAAAADPNREPIPVEEVADRRAAIARALELATLLAVPGEPSRSAGVRRPTVLVAGKGHETGQEVSGKVYPFDDRVVLGEELTRLELSLAAHGHPTPAPQPPGGNSRRDPSGTAIDVRSDARPTTEGRP